MRTNAITSVSIICLLLATAIGSVLPIAFAGETTFLEEFDNGTYRDASSTVTGWGSGAISLPIISPPQISSTTPGWTSNDLDLEGDVAYIADANGLFSVNITNTSFPVTMDSYSSGSTMYSVDAEGGLALIGETSNLRAFNISNPSDLRQISTLVLANTAWNIFIDGDWAFIANDASGLSAVNISNPTSIGPIYSIGMSGGPTVYDVDVDGGLAYVAHSNGFSIVNVTDPRNMVRLSTTAQTGTVRSVDIEGDVLYVGSCQWTGSIYRYYLSSYNVTNSSNPAFLDQITTDWSSGWDARDIEVDGDFLFLSLYLDGIMSVNVSNVSDMRWTGSRMTPVGSARQIKKNGMDLFVVTGMGNLEIYKVYENITPVKKSTTSVGITQAIDIFISGDYAYVLEGMNGIEIYNITNPEAPTFMGMYFLPFAPNRFWVAGDIAYVAWASQDLYLINVSNPYSPTLMGTWAAASFSYDVTTRLDTAFVAQGATGLCILNISNPFSPYQMGVYNTAGSARGVWVAGDVAYVADFNNGLVTVNISNPTAPTFMDSYTTTGNAVDVQVVGNEAYVVDDGYGLLVLDVSNPTDIKPLYSKSLSGAPERVFVYGDNVLMSLRTGGLTVLNMSNPITPSIMANISEQTDARAAWAAGNYTFIINGTTLVTYKTYRLIADSFAMSAVAMSTTVDTTTFPLVAVNMSVNETKPAGTAIYYNVSNDWGTTWVPITPGVLTYFPAYSSSLIWRANLYTSDGSATPVVQNVTFQYYFDNVLPTSSATTPEFKKSGSIPVTWTANDPFPATGISRTWLYYRYDANMDGDFIDVGDLPWTLAPNPSMTGTAGVFYFNPNENNGRYEFFTYSQDNAGNWESIPGADDSTVFDNVAPTSSCNGGSPAYQTSGAIIVYYNASDVSPGSGLANVTLYYRYDANADGDFSDPGDVDWSDSGLTPKTASQGSFSYNPGVKEGVYEFKTVALDNATNSEADFPFVRDTYTIYDGKAPTTTTFLSGTVRPSGWYIGTVDVFISATDNVSGVNKTYYRIDGGSWQTYTAPFKVTGNGAHTVQVYSIDFAGNTETTASYGVSIDNLVPTTTLTLTGAMGKNGWYVSNVTVNLVGSDAHSGINATKYRLDNGAYANFTAQFNISADGEHTLDYYSLDNALNEEDALSASLKIDQTKPTTASYVFGNLQNGWYTGSVSVVLGAVDTASGVNATLYRMDGGAWNVYGLPVSLATEGTHIIDFMSEDKAGNMEAMKNSTIRIDNTAPVTTGHLNGTCLCILSGWYVTNVSVNFSVSDLHSGLNRTMYKLDDGQWTVYTGEFLITTEGIHILEFYSIDNAGNREGSQSVQVKIDLNPPMISYSLSDVPNENGVFASPPVATLTAMDHVAGVSMIEYTEDETLTTWTQYMAPFKVTGDGKHVVFFKAVDEAGNTASPGSFEVVLDTTKPNITIDLSGDSSGDWFLSPVNVTVKAEDGIGKIAKVEMSIDKGPWVEYTGKFMLTEEGERKVEARATDWAGHVSDVASVAVRIDTAPPTVTAGLDGQKGENGWFTSKVTVNLKAEDRTSGLAFIKFKVDGGGATWLDYTEPFTIKNDGPHVVEFFAGDVAGNNATVSAINLSINNKAPKVKISSPLDGSVTGNATIKMEGKVEAGAAEILRVTVEGKNVPFGKDGKFEADVALKEGENTLTVDTVDAAGLSDKAKVTITLDTQPPTVTISTPASDLKTSEPSILVQGATEPGTTVTVNGAPVAVDPVGGFSTTVTLVDGPNPISIKATDPQGNPFEVTRTVTKEKARKGTGDTELTMSQALPWFLLIIILLAVVATILGYMAGRKARNREEISRLDTDRDQRERRPPPPRYDGWAGQGQQPRHQEPETRFDEMPPEEDAAMAGGAMAAGAVAASSEDPPVVAVWRCG